MTALTLTPQPSTASVLIQITGAPAGPVVITRSDANGVATVRLREGQEPISGSLTLSDFEPALVGPLAYDVVDSAGDTTSDSTTLAGTVARPQIGGVQQPGLEFDPELVTGYDANRPGASTVHRVIGRADPVITLAPSHTREGRLSVWCRDHEEAVTAARVLAQARILMFRQPTHPGMDMYFYAENVTTRPLQATADGWRWVTECDYLELRSPTLPLLGAAGWTFGDVVASFPTFAAVRSAFADFDALLVGA